MQGLKLELAAEYLLMAAVLAEIKSRLLLPRLSSKEEEEDPRAELVRRLKEYEQIKQAAENIDDLPRVERDTFLVFLPQFDVETRKPQPEVTLKELLLALDNVLNRESWRTPHLIQRELLSVRQRMLLILEKLEGKDFISFQQLLHFEEGRLGVVVTLIAILELLKQIAIEIVQTESYAPIHIKVIDT
jgi:segregation and condensation protein A